MATKPVYEDDTSTDYGDDAMGVDAAVAAQRARAEGEASDGPEQITASPQPKARPMQPSSKVTPSAAPVRKTTPSAAPVRKAAPSVASYSNEGRGAKAPTVTPAVPSKAGAGRGVINRQAETRDRSGYTDSERAANRAKLSGAVKSGLSGVGDYLKSIGTVSGRDAAKKAAEARWKSKSGSDSTMSEDGAAMKRGGSVKKMASGGFTRSADGIAQRGKTRAQQFCGGGMSKGKR
jgi:hypothetical protein